MLLQAAILSGDQAFGDEICFLHESFGVDLVMVGEEESLSADLWWHRRLKACRRLFLCWCRRKWFRVSSRHGVWWLSRSNLLSSWKVSPCKTQKLAGSGFAIERLKHSFVLFLSSQILSYMHQCHESFEVTYNRKLTEDSRLYTVQSRWISLRNVCRKVGLVYPRMNGGMMWFICNKMPIINSNNPDERLLVM